MKYNIGDTSHLQHLAMIIILVLPEHNQVDYNSDVCGFLVIKYLKGTFLNNLMG